jgi:hypothetical protein
VGTAATVVDVVALRAAAASATASAFSAASAAALAAVSALTAAAAAAFAAFAALVSAGAVELVHALSDRTKTTAAITPSLRTMLIVSAGQGFECPHTAPVEAKRFS